MTPILSERQCRALRALDGGPRSAAQFHGRTVSSLLEWGFVVKDGERLALTARGANLAATIEVDAHEPRPQPMGVVRPASRPLAPSAAELPSAADGMAEICCEGFEAAHAADVLVVGADGATYISSRKRWWRIPRCPWCGEKRA